jgi:hypothetical protein
MPLTTHPTQPSPPNLHIPPQNKNLLRCFIIIEGQLDNQFDRRGFGGEENVEGEGGFGRVGGLSLGAGLGNLITDIKE